jgi:hypothetical protein
VNCGSTASTKTVTLENTGAASFAWTGSLRTTYYTISPTSGSLGVGGSVPITITPNAIPASSPTTPDLYADTLSVTTVPALESPYVSSIHETAQGAILSFSPDSITFPNTRAGNSNTQGFSVVNDGNLAADVTLVASTQSPASNPNVFFAQTSPLTVNASSSANDNVKWSVPWFAPSGTVYTGTVTPTTTAVVCKTTLPTLDLSGTVK